MAENRIRFRADLDDKVTSKLGKMRDDFDRLGKSKGFKGLVQGVGIGAGIDGYSQLKQAVGAVSSFIGDSIKAASDMNETLSKSQVVFGSSARSIESFGDSAAQSMGLSKRAAIAAAADFGNFFTGIGKSEGAAAAMSKNLVALASDLASFNNLDPTDTLDKLRAGLAGEAEPLRRVGVFLTEAKVKAKAMELGLADANGELSEGAKITARYHLILEETTNAQGDFARTADDLANSQRTANAALEDAQASLGKKLLPAQLSVTNAQIDLFSSLEAYGDIISGKTTPETLALARAYGGLNDEQLRVALSTLEATNRAKFMASALKDDRVAAKELTPSMLRAMEATEKFHKEAKTAKDRSDALRDSMTKTANTLIEDYYRPIEIRQELGANKAEITAARRILASKNSTAAEIRDAKRTLTEAAKNNDQLALELLETGEMTTSETRAYFSNLNSRIKSSTGDAKTYLINLRKEALKINNLKLYLNFVARVRSQGIGAEVHGGGLAHGGPAHPFTTYTVGEHGPETLVMGATPGYVIPNDGGGGGNVIQLVVDGKVLAEVADRHNYRKLQRSAPTSLRP